MLMRHLYFIMRSVSQFGLITFEVCLVATVGQHRSGPKELI